MLTDEVATRLLAPLANTLAADGYTLAAATTASGLALHVSAGPDACEECLVPRSLFLSIVRDVFAKAGAADDIGELTITYPVDEH